LRPSRQARVTKHYARSAFLRAPGRCSMHGHDPWREPTKASANPCPGSTLVKWPPMAFRSPLVFSHDTQSSRVSESGFWPAFMHELVRSAIPDLPRKSSAWPFLLLLFARPVGMVQQAMVRTACLCAFPLTDRVRSAGEHAACLYSGSPGAAKATTHRR